MGYAVDYKPTRKKSPATAAKVRRFKAMVKYALPVIVRRCECSETITRPELMELIGISVHAPAADNDLQLILSDKTGAGIRPVGRMMGLKTYRCSDVVTSLREWSK